MNLLIDENLTPSMVQLLAARGVAAVHVAHIGMPGATDPEVWRYAFEHEQIVVTTTPPTSCVSRESADLHPGLIVLRIAGGLSRDEQWAWVEPVVNWLLTTGEMFCEQGGGGDREGRCRWPGAERGVPAHRSLSTYSRSRTADSSGPFQYGSIHRDTPVGPSPGPPAASGRGP